MKFHRTTRPNMISLWQLLAPPGITALIIGPGGISTVIIHAAPPPRSTRTIACHSAGAVISVICYLSLLAAAKVSRWLGETGLTVLNRIILEHAAGGGGREIVIAGITGCFHN